jgi:hypothetical protein
MGKRFPPGKKNVNARRGKEIPTPIGRGAQENSDSAIYTSFPLMPSWHQIWFGRGHANQE